MHNNPNHQSKYYGEKQPLCRTGDSERMMLLFYGLPSSIDYQRLRKPVHGLSSEGQYSTADLMREFMELAARSDLTYGLPQAMCDGLRDRVEQYRWLLQCSMPPVLRVIAYR